MTSVLTSILRIYSNELILKRRSSPTFFSFPCTSKYFQNHSNWRTKLSIFRIPCELSWKTTIWKFSISKSIKKNFSQLKKNSIVSIILNYSFFLIFMILKFITSAKSWSMGNPNVKFLLTKIHWNKQIL